MPRIILLLALTFQINLFSQKTLDLSKIDRSVIVMDGLISQDEIENAVIKTVDYEWRPGDNTPARYQTELFLSYTSEELYVIVKAYGNPDEIRGQVRPRDQMVEGLNEVKGISCVNPGGAMYVFPNITKTGMDSDTFSEYVLDKIGVGVLPGNNFGENGEGYIRMCYATSQEDILLALSRLKNLFG